MKILFCWTGVTSYMADCWRELAKREGVELRIVIEPVESGRAFKSAETLKGLDWELWECGALQDATAGRPDVIFAGGWRSRMTRAMLAAYPDVPKVFCLDMPWRRTLRCFLARFALRGFLRRFASVYVPGASSARYARWLGFREGEIIRGLYAVNQERLRAAASASPARRGFLFVGRYAPEKRRDLVERAHARYRALGGTWELDCYGQGGTFVQAADMPRVYAEHACLVLASAFDPWPLVMLEARSAGLEVIASDRCGNADELGARKVPFGDVEAMARAMLAVEQGARVEAPPLAIYGCSAWAARTLRLARAVVAGERNPAGEADGMAVVERLLGEHALVAPDEVWVHGMWTPDKWARCLGALRAGKRLVRMTHGALSPVYLRHSGRWKKRLVAPLEKFLFARAGRVIFTCPAEAEWFARWAPALKPKTDILDLKRFFAFDAAGCAAKRAEIARRDRPLRVLCLARRHPLKGVAELERAVAELNAAAGGDARRRVELRVVSDHFGEQLEADWAWSDVLCLPSLSENFGLVVAEALSRGRPVIATDGAPAWSDLAPPCGTFVTGYLAAADAAARARLLRVGIEGLL